MAQKDVGNKVPIYKLKKTDEVMKYYDEWGEDNKYDKIYVDLNDDQYCIDLAAKNIKSLKRILKTNGTITAQVGSQDKKPKQVDKWLNLFEKSFGNTSLDRVYIPSFDCSWNFASSLNK